MGDSTVDICSHIPSLLHAVKAQLASTAVTVDHRACTAWPFNRAGQWTKLLASCLLAWNSKKSYRRYLLHVACNRIKLGFCKRNSGITFPPYYVSDASAQWHKGDLLHLLQLFRLSAEFTSEVFDIAEPTLYISDLVVFAPHVGRF